MKDRRLTRRSLRSRSPLVITKQRQRPHTRPDRSSGRRNASRERAQYHPYRRLDHGKERSHNPSPPPKNRYRSLSPQPLSLDDDYRFQHNYILPDRPSFNPSWKPSQSIKDREFRSHLNGALPPSLLEIGKQGMLLQDSTFMGEGTSRSHFSDLPMGSTVPGLDRLKRSGDGLKTGMQESDIQSYNNDRHGDPYYDMDRRHINTSDLPIPKLSFSHMSLFNSTYTSGMPKEEFKALHHNRVSDGLSTCMGRNPNDPLEHYTYNQLPEPCPVRDDLLNDSRKIYHDGELCRRDLNDYQHRVYDDLSKRLPRTSQTEFRDATYILDSAGDHMDKADSPNRNFVERTFSDHHHGLRDVAYDYVDVRDQQELMTYSGHRHGRLRIKSSRDFEGMPFEEGLTSEKDFFPISYGAEHRSTRPLLSDHDLDEHRPFMSACDRLYIDNFRDYDVEKMESRNYDLQEAIGDNDSRNMLMNNRHSFVPYKSEEMWLPEELVGPSMSKSKLIEHSQYRNVSRPISTSDTFMRLRDASSMHEERDHNINLKRRLNHSRSNYCATSFSERKEDFLRPLKRGMQDRLGVQGRGTHDSDALVVKHDPPEDSEEFKQQIHKAFLRFSKLLNENPSTRTIYQNQGNTCSLRCTVCGSTSREFVDTNSLITHCYHSHKAGLKTAHLGFHKAICVLLGWNWHVPPDNSRTYQTMHVAEANATREDLILWPPIVIIHNSLIGLNNSTMIANVVTVEILEKILRDMGFGSGMNRVCLGKPANKSIFIVKFVPTFSGLQTAERLHKHFMDKKHGKQEFRQYSSSGKRSGGRQTQQLNEILYGYIAVAEDLDKLDRVTKRKSLIKSKKDDIEAIASVTLNAN